MVLFTRYLLEKKIVLAKSMMVMVGVSTLQKAERFFLCNISWK